MKDMGEAKVILGVKIIRMGDSIMLSQEHYVEKILKRFGHFDAKPVSTPYDANTHLMKNRGDPMGQAEYAQIIRSLMHLMNFSRPVHVGHNFLFLFLLKNPLFTTQLWLR